MIKDAAKQQQRRPGDEAADAAKDAAENGGGLGGQSQLPPPLANRRRQLQQGGARTPMQTHLRKMWGNVEKKKKMAKLETELLGCPEKHAPLSHKKVLESCLSCCTIDTQI